VAVKILDRMKSRAIRLRLEVEILLQASHDVQHPHLIALLDVFYTNTAVQMVFEYVAGGELFDYVVRHGAVSEARAARLLREMTEVRGMEWGEGGGFVRGTAFWRVGFLLWKHKAPPLLPHILSRRCVTCMRVGSSTGT
jgi:serine/threonine protein kinase